MASILKVGDRWRAQIRRKGHQSIAETFPTKARAVIWAREIEAEMDARKFKDVRGLANVTLKTLIDRYTEEIGSEQPFGRNKSAVLNNWVKNHDDKALSELTDDYLTKFVRDRRKGGAGGVTIGIDLTYLASVFKTAKELWKLPLSLDPIKTARTNMAHLKISTRSAERTRRPTNEELGALQNYLDTHSSLPMRDIIDFAVESAMRIGEITRLRWIDLNESDRTIIIRDRKHPRQKVGNDQEVPLLGKTFGIVKRQPKPADMREDSRIFRWKLTRSLRSSHAPRPHSASSTCIFTPCAMKVSLDCSSKGIASNKWPLFLAIAIGRCLLDTRRLEPKTCIDRIRVRRSP